MARSENSIVFWSFYAGSALCSPTRSAALTGRTPNRECISAPEPHGYGPSYSCFSPLPLSPRTVTIAEVAKSASYDTFHSGKWHLGDFFPKRSLGEQPNFANAKWPVSNPSTHGFDAWHSTEASGPSSTPNCGCDAAWKTEGQGCVSGGGVWRKDRAWVCMDYWSPDPNASAVCKSAHNATLAGCVVNETSKIQGDDAEHIIESFETFLDTREGGGGAAHTRESEDSAAVAPALSPFLAVLWLHTIHFPRGALPRYYHAYNDTFGDPAGDYLGSITQMDVQVGRLRELLRSRGIAENTMLWYTSDNGPNAESQPGVVGKRDRSLNPQYAATNGLRQCKASLYEGGIRVPGILEYPRLITHNVETTFPAYVSDYMPTFLAVTNQRHPLPDWAADGISLLPLITALGAPGSPRNDSTSRSSAHPLVFQLREQSALIDNAWKILQNPVAGHCNKEPLSIFGANRKLLYNLALDPTESVDLSESKDPGIAARYANMSARLDALARSIEHSAVFESECKSTNETTSFAAEPTAMPPGCISPLGPIAPTPTPPTPPPGPPFALRLQRSTATLCMAATTGDERGDVTLAPCNTNSDAAMGMDFQLQEWRLTNSESAQRGAIVLNGTALCPKLKVKCGLNSTLWLGLENCHQYGFVYHEEGETVEMIDGSKACGSTPLCLAGVVTEAGGSSQMLHLRVGACSSPTAQGWTMVPL